MSAPRSNSPVSRSDSEHEGAHEDKQTDTPGLADAYDVYAGYLPSLRAHAQDTIAHLTGSTPSHEDTCVGPATKSSSTLPEARQTKGDRDLSPREPEPTIWHSSLSPWSQSEVDAFFHALSVYSRWRPDLIADAVRTKGEVEVVEFLLTLNSYAQSCATETHQGICEIAPNLPTAIEVSEKWVAAEEAMAAVIAAEEDAVELRELEVLRKKRVMDVNADIIPRGKRRRVTNRDLMDNETERGGGDDVEIINTETARFEEWHAGKVAVWKREDLLRRLEDAHLQILDTILREDEEAQKEINLTCEPVHASGTDIGVDLKILSPMSRRRLTKRLYMRRKRAQLRGEDVGEAGEVPTLKRMKTGKKSDKKGKEKGSLVVAETGSERLPLDEFAGSHTGDCDGHEDASRATASKSRRQSIKAEFDNVGIDASYLHKHDMDLFHYASFGKLVGIFKPLAQCTEDDTSASYISADLLRYLQASVVAFTTDIIRRAINWKEQDNELKDQKKVWNGALDQINQAAVEHALKAIGVRTMNKREYFARLIDYYDVSSNEQICKGRSSSPVATDAEDEQLSIARHSPDVQSSQHETELSPHRALYTPAFLAPAMFNIHIVDNFFSGYDACFPSNTRIHEDSCDIEDLLLSSETDEEALEHELQEDEILDEADLESGKRFEEHLWAEVRRECRRGI